MGAKSSQSKKKRSPAPLTSNDPNKPKLGTAAGQIAFKHGWDQPLTNEILDAWEQEDYDEEYRRAFAPRR